MSARVATLAVLALGLAGCDETPIEPVDAGDEGADAGAVGADGGARADGGSLSDDGGIAGVDAGAPAEGSVPMFVAYGHAARTLTSCDGGETWIGEHSFEADGHDHSEYSGLGRMTYGDGRFIGCAGWGNPTRIVISEDGLAWDDLPDAAFALEDGSSERPRQGCSGVAYDGARYGFVAGSRLFTSADGRGWTRHAERVPGSDNIRAVGGGDGLLIFIRGGAYLSDDGGDSWYEGTGYVGACSDGVQRGGGILVNGDRVLIGGRGGTVCVSEDRGRSFRSVAVTTNVRFILWDGAEYIASAGRGEIHRSRDGLVWARVDHDAGVELAALAHGPGLGYVAVARDAQSFFTSPDATRWSTASSEGTDDDYLWTITFGYGRASARCPAE